jgi:taurine dioxygenase
MSGALGVEQRGLPVAELDTGEILDQVHEQGLVVLREQVLTPASLMELASRLGEPAAYPFAEPLAGFPFVVEVVKNPEDQSNFGGAWHTDTSYLPEPPGLTILYAVEIPPIGGDTLFADMRTAYEALSANLQRVLDGLIAHNSADMVHDGAGDYAAVAGQGVALKGSDTVTEADHPAVRVHPVTGRRALYLSLIHTERFDGMTREESLPLLTYLQAFAVRAERCTRLRWQQGTLAIWDNRSVQHYPLNDYPGQRREMHRVILRGEKPLGPN